jgi:O-acetyl-ADP-ribose deacetylase (regulator of RNase III)
VAATVELRYRHTCIELAEGEPVDFLRESVLVAVNARGVMASGFAGAVRRAAGAGTERALRARGTLLVGQAYLVGPGQLAQRGVRHIICAVTTPQPGAAPRRSAVEEALNAGLLVLAQTRARALTLPEIGTRIPGITLGDAAHLLIAILTGHLRRGLALDEVIIAGLHREYLHACHAALEAAGATAVASSREGG